MHDAEFEEKLTLGSKNDMTNLVNFNDDVDDGLSLLYVFPAGTIARNPHHLKSPTRREQDLNLRGT